MHHICLNLPTVTLILTVKITVNVHSAKGSPALGTGGHCTTLHHSCYHHTIIHRASSDFFEIPFILYRTISPLHFRDELTEINFFIKKLYKYRRFRFCMQHYCLVKLVLVKKCGSYYLTQHAATLNASQMLFNQCRRSKILINFQYIIIRTLKLAILHILLMILYFYSSNILNYRLGVLWYESFKGVDQNTFSTTAVTQFSTK